MIKWNLVKLNDDTKIGGVVNKERGLALQADRNCLDGWLQASNTHFKITECRVIQVIYGGLDNKLCLGPCGLRKGFRDTEDRCHYRSSHSNGTAAESSVVFGCVRRVSGRNHKLSCLHSPRYWCPSLEKTMKESVCIQMKYETGLGKTFRLLWHRHNTNAELEAKG